MTELEAAKQYCASVKSATGRDSAPENAFIAGAQWKDKQSPWISVEERLPDHMQAVWVRSKINDHQQLRFCDGKFYTSFAHQTYDGGVTHWMPIPE